MNEFSIEHLSKKPKQFLPFYGAFAMYIIGALAIAGGVLSFGVLFAFIGILLIVAGSFVQKLADIEYEYLYLDKELTVDKIIAQNSRKQAAVYQMSTLEVMAPLGSHHLDSYANLAKKDYSSENKENNPYVIVLQGKNNERVQVVIDATDELIKAVRMIAPRFVFTD